MGELNILRPSPRLLLNCGVAIALTRWIYCQLHFVPCAVGSLACAGVPGSPSPFLPLSPQWHVVIMGIIPSSHVLVLYLLPIIFYIQQQVDVGTHSCILYVVHHRLKLRTQ